MTRQTRLQRIKEIFFDYFPILKQRPSREYLLEVFEFLLAAKDPTMSIDDLKRRFRPGFTVEEIDGVEIIKRKKFSFSEDNDALTVDFVVRNYGTDIGRFLEAVKKDDLRRSLFPIELGFNKVIDTRLPEGYKEEIKRFKMQQDQLSLEDLRKYFGPGWIIATDFPEDWEETVGKFVERRTEIILSDEALYSRYDEFVDAINAFPGESIEDSIEDSEG